MATPAPDGGSSTATADLGSIAGMIAGLSGAMAGASELIMDAVTISQVRQHLMNAQTHLVEAQAKMPAIAASTVGGSWWGSQVSHHSTLAHERLLETIQEMNTGLDHYEAAMLTAQKGVTTTDETSQTDYDRGSQCTSEVSTAVALPSCQG